MIPTAVLLAAHGRTLKSDEELQRPQRYLPYSEGRQRPTGVVSGRTGVRAKAAVPLRVAHRSADPFQRKLAVLMSQKINGLPISFFLGRIGFTALYRSSARTSEVDARIANFTERPRSERG